MIDRPPLERALEDAGLLPKFADACRASFSGQSGVDLMECLLQLAHPLFPQCGKDTHDTYRNIGRQEIVTLLARFSGIPFSPANSNKTTT